MNGDRRSLLPRAILSVAVLVVVALLLAALGPVSPGSRTLSLQELREGRDFRLADVLFDQTRFDESLTHIDGSALVEYRLTFPDGSSERVDFAFDGYCPSGAVSQFDTEHEHPRVVFQHVCGDDAIRVTVV